MGSKHSDAKLVHRLHRWVFADETARLAKLETVALTTSIAVNDTLNNAIKLVPNEIVYFSAVPASSGLSINTPYYVIAGTTPLNVKLSLTLGGSAINITAAGSVTINKISVSFSSADIGKRAYQQDTNAFWDVSDVSSGVPVWITYPVIYAATTALETPVHRLDTANLTTSSVADYFLNTGYSITSFRVIYCKLLITSGADYQTTSFSLLHNGTSAFLEQLGGNDDSGVLASIDADINVASNGLLRIIVRPTNAVTTFQAVLEAFKI